MSVGWTNPTQQEGLISPCCVLERAYPPGRRCGLTVAGVVVVVVVKRKIFLASASTLPGLVVKIESGGDGSLNSLKVVVVSVLQRLDIAAASVLRCAAPLRNWGIWGRLTCRAGWRKP